MALHVLDCRIFFSDAGNASNAYEHIKALAQQSAAFDVQVGAEIEASWGRLHDCRADELAGDTAQCATTAEFVLSAPAPDPGDPPIAWAPDLTVAVGDYYTYDGITYVVIQAHTTQVGWEPPNVPALWGVV